VRSNAARERERLRRRGTVIIGDFVYADTPRGLVRCRVLSITGEQVAVVVTSDGGGYDRGEVAWFPTTQVFPLSRIYRRQGRYFVSAGPLTFVSDTDRQTLAIQTHEVVYP
jgi:hypothetical protein